MGADLRLELPVTVFPAVMSGDGVRPAVLAAGALGAEVSDLADFQLLDGPTGPVLAVAGELDTHTSRALRAGLAAAGAEGVDVVVDLTGVTFADSATLGVFVAEHKRLGAAGRSLVLLGPGPAVRRVLELSGLLHVLVVRDVAA